MSQNEESQKILEDRIISCVKKGKHPIIEGKMDLVHKYYWKNRLTIGGKSETRFSFMSLHYMSLYHVFKKEKSHENTRKEHKIIF